jgi:pimeloyl-ACP methyl ester carboxylesterase
MATTLRHGTIQSAAHRTHFVEAGAGPLVLFVHGFPEFWYSWRHQLHALADAGYRAVAVDQRGFGRSSRPRRSSDYRVTELVADLVRVVHGLGAAEAVIVGHDIGAPVAWSAAWTRPDVFRGVVGVSGPFGGRGQFAFPGSPFGERRPSELEREIAGDGQLGYQEYLNLPEGFPETEFESDTRGWLTDNFYTFSASAPQSAHQVDYAALTDGELHQVMRDSPRCFPLGSGMRAALHPAPAQLPSWLTSDDLEQYVAEFERTGFTGALNHYRCVDLNWEILAPFEGRPVEVPALFVIGARDGGLHLRRTAIERIREHVPRLTRPPLVIEDCGHWVAQEKPDELNAALLEFLAGLA